MLLGDRGGLGGAVGLGWGGPIRGRGGWAWRGQGLAALGKRLAPQGLHVGRPGRGVGLGQHPGHGAAVLVAGEELAQGWLRPLWGRPAGGGMGATAVGAGGEADPAAPAAPTPTPTSTGRLGDGGGGEGWGGGLGGRGGLDVLAALGLELQLVVLGVDLAQCRQHLRQAREVGARFRCPQNPLQAALLQLRPLGPVLCHPQSSAGQGKGMLGQVLDRGNPPFDLHGECRWPQIAERDRQYIFVNVGVAFRQEISVLLHCLQVLQGLRCPKIRPQRLRLALCPQLQEEKLVAPADRPLHLEDSVPPGKERGGELRQLHGPGLR